MSTAESPPGTEKPTNNGAGAAGQEYLRLIVEQLEEERKAKTSIEQRGITVITTAGTLVTLLFALVALLIKSDSFKPEPTPRFLLYGALGAFVAAAVVALATNFPMNYREADVEKLASLTQERFWRGSSEIGSRRSAEVRVDVLRAARHANRSKANMLRTAVALEVVAVAFTCYGRRGHPVDGPLI